MSEQATAPSVARDRAVHVRALIVVSRQSHGSVAVDDEVALETDRLLARVRWLCAADVTGWTELAAAVLQGPRARVRLLSGAERAHHESDADGGAQQWRDEIGSAAHVTVQINVDQKDTGAADGNAPELGHLSRVSSQPLRRGRSLPAVDCERQCGPPCRWCPPRRPWCDPCPRPCRLRKEEHKQDRRGEAWLRTQRYRAAAMVQVGARPERQYGSGAAMSSREGGKRRLGVGVEGAWQGRALAENCGRETRPVDSLQRL